MAEMERTSGDIHEVEIQEVPDHGHQQSQELLPRAASPDNIDVHATSFTLVMYYAMAVVAGLLVGVENNVIGGVLATRPILGQFLYQKWDEQSTATQTTVCQYINVPVQVLNVAYTVGALPFFVTAATIYTQRRGHRLLVTGAVLHILGHGFHFRPTLVFLVTGRILAGAGTGVIILAVQRLINNISQIDHRGKIENAYVYTTVIGAPLAYIISTVGNLHYPEMAWKISFVSNLPLSVLLLIFSYFFYFHGVGSSNGMDVSLRNSISLLFSEENYKKTIITTVQTVMIPMTDFGLFLVWSPVILLSFGVTVEIIYIIILVLSIIQCISICFSIFIVKVFGRRLLLLYCGTSMIITQIIMGGLIIASGNPRDGFSRLTGTSVLIYLGMFLVFNGGLGTMAGWLEDPLPDSCKFGSLLYVQCISFIMQTIVLWTSLPLFCRLGGFTLFFLAAIVVIIVVFVYLFIRDD